jgi:putative transposase
MPQSLSNVLVHIIFSTKNREPFLNDPELRAEMHRVLGGICNDRGSQSIIVGGVEDHVHILARQSRTLTLSDWVKELKRQSNLWIQSSRQCSRDFKWQSGYGAFSVGNSQKNDVIAYIKNQEEHHRTQTFQEEFLRFLELHEIEYDDRFIWK